MCGINIIFIIVLLYFSGVLHFLCPKSNCKRMYKSKNALYTHLKYECGKKPQFICNLCMKSFKQPGNYKSHMIAIHKKLVGDSYRCTAVFGGATMSPLKEF